MDVDDAAVVLVPTRAVEVVVLTGPGSTGMGRMTGGGGLVPLSSGAGPIIVAIRLARATEPERFGCTWSHRNSGLARTVSAQGATTTFGYRWAVA